MTKRKHTIDVIIPLYNCAQYIREAIDSVMSQTYAPERIIVIDDGSTDVSGEIVKKIIAAGTRVKLEYYHKKNGGLSSARNFGIEHSDAEFVAFLDSDDTWLPSKLEKQIKCFEAGNVNLGLVYCGYQVIDENSRFTDQHFVLKIDPEMKGEVFIKLLHSNTISSSGSGVMIKRECFRTVGLFDETLKASEDWDMWLRISEKYEIDYVNEVLVNIRRHSSNMQGNFDHMLKNMISFFSKWMKRKDIPRPVYLQWGHIIAEFILKTKDKNKSVQDVCEALTSGERRKLYYRTGGSIKLYLALKKIRRSINKQK